MLWRVKMFRVQYLKLGLVWGLLALVLSGCAGETGFHLRGSDPMGVIKLKIALAGDTKSEWGQLVKSSLQSRGATLTDEASAEVLLTLQSPVESKRVSGYSSTRAVSAFRYSTEAKFSIKRQGSTEVVNDSVAQSQVQAYDSEYVLGTQEEADQIKTNLRRDVARLLALKMAALQRKNP
ncbi:MAG: hypothetical protein RLZZ422_2437 [Pseudomonadota bacterium]